MIANILAVAVACAHLGFLYLEMFLWTKPTGLKIFRLSREQAENSALLAKNQGLYNGFLAAGLLWSVFTAPELRHPLQMFFFLCVIVAGVFGAYTVNKRIFFVQALPAILGLLAVLGGI